MWQKERLLNIGIERAPLHCTKIVWADLDVDFLRDSWVQEASALLETHKVIQPFAWAYRMMPTETTADLSEAKVLSEIPSGAGDGQVLHSAGFGLSVLRSMNRSEDGLNARLRGHSGYACAARRDFLQSIGGLYDRMITGGGDDIMAKAWQNLGVVGQGHDKYPVGLQQHAQHWIDSVGAKTEGNIGYLKGVLLHHFHGSQSNRHYAMRMSILRTHNFDPVRDIFKNADGVWEWRSNENSKFAR